ncbi:GTP-binding protein gtr2 [Diplonema papillatum]|nr:GTP-binding protein gtr2 [Diplonema papillatum]
MAKNYGGADDSYTNGEAASEDMSVSEVQPRVLLMGLKKSGKTSIQKVVFQKVSPHETVLLETSTKMQKLDISNNSFVQFQIWDFPGQLMDLFDEDDDEGDMDWDKVFAGHGAVVFVIDCADKWPPAEAVKRLTQTIVRVVTTPGNNKPKNFEIFIHKVDCLKSEQSQEKHLDVKRFVEEELNIQIRDRAKTDEVLAQFDVRSFVATAVHYHMTSIYDHSVFDAFSKVVQRVIGHLHDCITALLGMLVTRCGMEKAYLFDVLSKIYVAQDEGVTAQMYEVCFDMIDVAIDISAIYGCPQPRAADEESVDGDDAALSPQDLYKPGGPEDSGSAFPFDSESCTVIRLDSKQVCT